MRKNLFAFDCGSTNWRIYRVSYDVERQNIQMHGEPLPSPLTSFLERRLPTVVLLDPSGSKIEDFGEPASQHLYDEHIRDRIRSFFKPSVGVHLERDPLPHQTRYNHQDALHYTKLLLQAVLEQLRMEKWRSRPFDDKVHFAFAYPVHWRDDYGGQIFSEFKQVVLGCLPMSFSNQIDFVTEPEAAVLSLQHQRLLNPRTKSVLLVDSGGSTTDLTAGEINHRGEMISTHRYGAPHGGGLYDDEIARYIVEKLDIPHVELEKDPNSMHLLRGYAGQLKESLSRQMLRSVGKVTPPQRTIAIILQSGESYRNTVKLDETTFHQITRHLTSKFEHIIDDALRVMHLHEQSIDQVALVGGSAQLFTIVRYLQQRFGKEKVILADNPSETVVHGLALAYGHTFGKSAWPDVTEQDKMPGYGHPARQNPTAPIQVVSRYQGQDPPSQEVSRYQGQDPPSQEVSHYQRQDPPSQEVGRYQRQDPPSQEIGRYQRQDPPSQEVGRYQRQESSSQEVVSHQNNVKTILERPWVLVSEEGQIYSLNNATTTIGRRTTNTIVLFDHRVSRNHAEIQVEPDGYKIKDLGSANGIYINGKKLIPKTVNSLQLNDKIRIGKTIFVCKEED